MSTNPEPAKIACDEVTRIIVQQAASGELFARIERLWDGAWVEFAQCSGGNGTFLINPTTKEQ